METPYYIIPANTLSGRVVLVAAKLQNPSMATVRVSTDTGHILGYITLNAATTYTNQLASVVVPANKSIKIEISGSFTADGSLPLIVMVAYQ